MHVILITNSSIKKHKQFSMLNIPFENLTIQNHQAEKPIFIFHSLRFTCKFSYFNIPFNGSIVFYSVFIYIHKRL